MFHYSEDENQQNPETAETSGSTPSSANSSTPSSSSGSTPPVEPVQPLEVPEIDGEKKYIQTSWTLSEIQKIFPKNFRKKINKYFHVVRKPSLHKPELVLEAEEFFEDEFPRRSPYAVYQKALKVGRNKYKRVILF